MISTSTCGVFEVDGVKHGMQAIADAGFQGYDMDLFTNTVVDIINGEQYLAKAKEFKKFASGYGLTCAQTHAPFPLYFPDDDARTRAIREQYEKAISVTAALGGRYMVTHPINVMMAHPRYGDNAYLKALNVEYISGVLSHAKKEGVVIALENLFASGFTKGSETYGSIVKSYCSSPTDLADLIDSLEGTVACLDSGHMLLTRFPSAGMIQTLGNRLKVLHLQSNNAVNDLHMPPYLHKNMDWAALAQALREINYTGWFNLEAFGFVANTPPELLDAAMRYMYASTKLFADQVLKQ